MNKTKTLKTVKIFIFLVLIVLAFSNMMEWRAKQHWASVTLKIVDEDGNIVPEADIFTHFVNVSRIQKDYRTKSDINGLCHAKGKTISHLFYIVSKDSYYTTKNRYSFIRQDQGKSRQRSRFFPWIMRWEPWNPTTTVILKKIENPIPMKVRKVELIFPGLEEYYPFDCDVGDWVEPYGKGEKAHIYII